MNSGNMLRSVYRFYKFLLTFRRVYFIFALFISLFFVYLFLQKKTLPVNKYVCSVSISNEQKEPQVYVSASNNAQEWYKNYTPAWQIKNPYNTNNLYKYYQSASFLRDAGRTINYRMRYFHKGKDIYEHRPIDLYVNNANEEDAFSAYVIATKEGCTLFVNDELDIKKLQINYSKPTQTPIGEIVLNKRNDDKYDNVKIRLVYGKESLVLQQLNDHIDRPRNNDIIAVNITSDYTFGFAKDLFDAMLKEFDRQIKAQYSQDFTEYQNNMDKAISMSKNDPELSHRLKALLTQAKMDSLIINNNNMAYYVDKPYMDKPELIKTAGSFRYIFAILLLLVLPTIFLLIEISINPLIINEGDLPKFIKEHIKYTVEGSMKNEDIKRIKFILSSENCSNFIISGASKRCMPIDTVESLSQKLDNSITTKSSLDMNIEALNIVRNDNTSKLILLIKLGCISTKKLLKIETLLIKANINPIVILFD